MVRILILFLIVVVLVAIRGVVWYMRVPREERVVACPECGKEFTPYLLRMIFTGASLEGKVVRCPHCGAQQYIVPSGRKKRRK